MQRQLMRELVNQHNHGIQPVITPVVQINANEWVTLELLMAVTGLRKGTILRARDSAWMNGREYKQIAPDGTPKKNSECLYHLPTINTWIKNQPLPSQDV